VNGPTFNTGNNGYITCDGVNDYIEVIDSSSLDFGATNFTVEYWFRKLQNTTSFRHIWGVNKWNTGAAAGTNEWSLGIGNGSSGNGNNYSFVLQSGNTNYSSGSSSDTLQLNIWYQLIGIREDNSIKVYLNSEKKLDNIPVGFTSSTVVNNVGRNLRINNSALNNFYTEADNAIIKIYNRALTPQEIQQNFNATRSRFGL
jgi:hypothetical protein